MNSNQRRVHQRWTKRALRNVSATVQLEDWSSGSPVAYGSKSSLTPVIVGRIRRTKRPLIVLMVTVPTGDWSSYPQLSQSPQMEF